METVKATLFYRDTSLLGNMVKREVKLHSCGLRPYAQYSNMPFVTFTVKRKRTEEMLHDSSVKPSIVAIAGWNHDIEPESAFNTENAKVLEDGTTITKGRRRSFSSDWQTNFDALFHQYIQNNPNTEIICDFRDVEIKSDRWES